MMIQEVKEGMKVRNAGGDIFRIKDVRGELVLVEMLEHNGNGFAVNYLHQTIIPGKVTEIKQTSEIDMLLPGWYEVTLEYLEPLEPVEPEIPMFDKGDIVKDKFGNLFEIYDVVFSEHFNWSAPEYDKMGYRLKLIGNYTTSSVRMAGNISGFYNTGEVLWIYNTKEDAELDEIKVTEDHLFATELELYDEFDVADESDDSANSAEADHAEDSDDPNKLEVPDFQVGDKVKDKFGNIYKIKDIDDAGNPDNMRYNLAFFERNSDSPVRKIGNVSGFYSDDACAWIYNSFKDALNDEILVTDAHIFATELELYDADELDADVSDESDDVPYLVYGDLVKDKFGNIFRIQDVERHKEDNMHYYLELVEQISSVKRYAGMYAEFDMPGICYWIYDTEEAAIANEVAVNGHFLYATELVLVQSVLQTKPAKAKSKIQKPATPAKAEKAEITKRYPSIEDLQKMSEENDLGKLLDQAYEILKEQASLGERRSNLEAETFKRCIPHFEREGFDITEHGTLIEVRW